jgi:hypothetical protein
MRSPSDPKTAAERIAKKETEGAWVVHHGRKIMMDTSGPAEFPSIDQAAKATSLIVALAGTDSADVPHEKVKAIARAARLNPKRELQTFLDLLEERRLIEQRKASIYVLGLTNRAALQHAADLFIAEDPQPTERAAIELAEITSIAPQPVSEVGEYIGDTYRFTKAETGDFIRRAEEIGFIDSEGDAKSRLIFNGNLFRRDSVAKAKKVLDSLSSAEHAKVAEFDDVLKRSGCVIVSTAKRLLGEALLNKLKAAGVYELHTVQNDMGQHVFATSPAAFHKFVSPMIDDAFDLAKALVAALSYGMTQRSRGTGRIQSIDVLLGRLIAGHSVGPATAIGQDYRVLEEKRVVELIPDGRLYSMRLLKREVGEIALQVLKKGDATATVVNALPTAAMSGYVGPEETRWSFRKVQGVPSKKETFGVIEALRSNRRF